MWSALKNYTDAALLFIRAALGSMLLCFHAWPLLLSAFSLWSHHGAHHSFWSNLWMTLIALGETLASLLLIIGLWTRPAALLIGALVARVALSDFHSGGVARAELHLDLLFLLVIFFFVGPGRFSCDKA